MSSTRKILAVAGGIALFSLIAAPGSMTLAQTATPAPRIHKRWTKMAAKANMLHDQVPKDIAEAKKNGKDVTAAEKYQAEGDAMLKAGHLALAVEHYQQAEKALK